MCINDLKCTSFIYGKGKRDHGNGLADCFINVSGQRQTGDDATLDAYISKDFLGNHTVWMYLIYRITQILSQTI